MEGSEGGGTGLARPGLAWPLPRRVGGWAVRCTLLLLLVTLSWSPMIECCTAAHMVGERGPGMPKARCSIPVANR